QINTSNVDKLGLAWSFDARKAGETVFRPTPLVVNGIMYVNTRTKLFALKGDTGDVLWSAPIYTPPGAPITSQADYSAALQNSSSALSVNEGYADYKQRGPTYGDGRIYIT